MRFITDTHLGKLAKYLRLLGFDTAHFREGPDTVLETRAEKEGWMILTRDRALSEKKEVNAYFLYYIVAQEQLKEILEHFGLKEVIHSADAWLCNGIVHEIMNPSAILHMIPPKVREFNNRYWQCKRCGKIYWHGTHYARMKSMIAGFCS